MKPYKERTVCSKVCGIAAAHQGTRDKIWTDEERRQSSVRRTQWLLDHPGVIERLIAAGADYRENMPQEEWDAHVRRWLDARRAKSPYGGESSIEKRVQRALDVLKVPYSTQVPIGNYTADIVLDGSTINIEVDGCYWHGCDHCGFGPRKVRDHWRDRYVERGGYRVVRIWEHEIRADIWQTVRKALDSVGVPYALL